MDILYNQIKDKYDVHVINSRFWGNKFSLRIKISNESKVYQKCPEAEFLSIIIPPDSYIYCYETALYSNSKGVVYNEELGYSDVCKFDNSDEVVKELERLGL